ncbi:hypothetical protein M413DRAFT_445743 [Hebeloma cylindrosporum]|uniref:Uncharacterized protein n=1 Tax=Hebeloma cylindrosporum TaxID=76867 RepID=A0A0C3BWI3_HEBCY|nr:hypothetical protein M413DRAFT_445743 [Hebeloma cylindrosporum h7]
MCSLSSGEWRNNSLQLLFRRINCYNLWSALMGRSVIEDDRCNAILTETTFTLSDGLCPL